MDIGSKSKYPANALSNFAPHPFMFDDAECFSMEGVLQAFKFKNWEMAKHICRLVGIRAKRAGSKKNWHKTQTLWWKGQSYKRLSTEYQLLLDRAYAALVTNKKFRAALLASGDSVLKHTIGRQKPQETVLTRQEFCSRLTRLRARVKMEDV